jgi:hypothetical protein
VNVSSVLLSSRVRRSYARALAVSSAARPISPRRSAGSSVAPRRRVGRGM